MSNDSDHSSLNLVDKLITFLGKSGVDQEEQRIQQLDDSLFHSIKLPRFKDPQVFFERLKRGYELVSKDK